jgi:hypothetical protein
MATSVDSRAAKVPRLINEADAAEFTVVLTDDGVAASAGGSLMDVGAAGNWYAAVWDDVDAASSGVAPLFETTITVPAEGTVHGVEAAADVKAAGDGTYWWALVRLSPRQTFYAGPYTIAAGWAGDA